MQDWVILTGEYPPQHGGVSDYTRQVVRALARAGDRVTVWAPPHPDPSPGESGVVVRRLPDHFGPRSLALLGAEIDRFDPSARLLVQYVPHAFGFKAMNLPFCLWLYSRRRSDLRVMFHEVAFPFRRGQSLRHQLLALMNRMMASLLARAARRIYVSTSAWEPLLRKIAPGSMVRALPAPSNLPTVAEEGRMSQIRLRFGPRAHLIGHFGTYSPSVTSLLVPLVPVLLAPDHARQVLLLGRGNCAFAERLLANFPHFSGRIHAIGDVSDDELVAHLAACDLLVQPYSDGVTTRRTTVMSGLALGVPILTTSGKLTEPFWAACGGVALVDVDDLALGGAAVVNSLLGDDSRRRQLGERGRALYRERFAIEHTIAALRAAN